MRLLLLGIAALAALWHFAPERPRIPVEAATRSDWNAMTFWHEPWGRSGVHKGIDIFAPKGTPVIAPTYGLVLFRGELALGGKVVVALGPGWLLHYFAHLDESSARPGQPALVEQWPGSGQRRPRAEAPRRPGSHRPRP